ncbi:MAG: lipocalin family protein [Steroidobacteraceae bacterium]
MRRIYKTTAAMALTMTLTAMLSACQTTHPPIATMTHVDLERFMGDWYVIANIPTFIERDAHNPVESYRLDEDGTIDTTFTFNKDSFDGPLKKYNPKGFVRDNQSNAIWGMQFVWPIKADYRIVYVSDAYDRTIIGRQARDYVWIMARTPQIPDAEYQALLEIVERQGYDMSKLQRVPQRSRDRSNVVAQ